MGIAEAREMFEKMGIPIDENGMISKDLSREQIDKLKEWYNNTMVNGIQMPTEQAFYENVLLATSLFPQTENENINYMFGKGIGIEVALRGEVANRTKNDIEFPYRSHSDFEMYGMDGDYDPTFREIFGAQERYPTTKTKGLAQIEPGLMADNAEKVNLDGVTLLVPQLEMLFLDKYLKQESTPRGEGVDAALLAKQYDLDYGRVYKYLLDYSIKPAIATGLEKQVLSKEKVSQNVNRFLGECEIDFVEDNDCYPERQELCDIINDKINSMMSISTNMSKNGIAISAYEEITPDDLIDMGNSKCGISNSYAKKIVNNLAKVQGKSFCDILQSFRNLNDFCNSNGIHSISEEQLRDMESTLEQYMVNQMGRDVKELDDRSIEEISVEYFAESGELQKDMIEH